MAARKQTIWIERFNLQCVLEHLAELASQLDLGCRDELIEPLGLILDYLDLAAAAEPGQTTWRGRWAVDRESQDRPSPTAFSEAEVRQALWTLFRALRSDPSVIGAFREAADHYLALRIRLAHEQTVDDIDDNRPSFGTIEEASRQDQMEQLLREITEHSRVGSGRIGVAIQISTRTRRAGRSASEHGAEPDAPEQGAELILLESARRSRLPGDGHDAA